MTIPPKLQDRRENDPVINVMLQALQDGSARMSAIETDVKALSDAVAPVQGIATALKWMVFASKVIGALLVVMVTLVGWVANDKNTDIKDMQKSVQAMAINNSEMLAVMKEIVENDARQQARIDRNTEILSGIRK
jgi:hypothetical protein